MQVGDTRREWRWRIVIAFDGENWRNTKRLLCLQNQAISGIAQSQNQIGLARTVSPVQVVNVGKNKRSHLFLILPLSQ